MFIAWTALLRATGFTRALATGYKIKQEILALYLEAIMRMRRIPQLLMFGILWAMLLGNLHLRVNRHILPDLAAFVDSLTGRQLKENRTAVEIFRAEQDFNNPYWQRQLPYYELMFRVRDTFGAIQSAIVQQEQFLRTKNCGWKYTRDARVKSLAGFVCTQLRRTRSFSQSLAGIESFPAILNIAFTPSLESAKQIVLRSEDSVFEHVADLFRGKSIADQIAVLSSIRYALSGFEELLLREIAVEGSLYHFSGGLSWYAALPRQEYAFPGVKAEAMIGLMTVARNRKILTSLVSTGFTRTEGEIVFWKGTAGTLGWQQVHGQLIFAYKDSVYQNVPWQFRYFSGPRFASISQVRRPFFSRQRNDTLRIEGVERFPPGSVRVACSGATIQQRRDLSYILCPDKHSSSVTAVLLLQHDHQTDTLERLRIPVRRAAAPIIKIGGKRSDLSISELQHSSEIGILNSDDDNEGADWSLTKCVIRFEDDQGNELGVFSMADPAFSSNSDLIQISRSLKPGYRIFIENAVGRDADGHELKLADAYFRLH